MRRIPVVLGVFAAALGVVLAPGQALTASNEPQVVLWDSFAAQNNLKPPPVDATHTVHVQADTQIEPSIAVNPNNPRNAVAAFQEGRVSGGGDQTNGFATTLDGGQTWTYGELPCLTYSTPEPRCPLGGPYDRASDAVVAFGPDNVVYANSLIFNDESSTIPTQTGTRSAIGINVSKDGGRTWSLPIIFQDDNLGGLNDKNWIVVDNSSDAGHHKGRVYAVWDRVAPVVYNYCDSACDNVANWLPNFLTMYPGQGIGALPLVLKDGSLGVIFGSLSGGTPPVTTGDNVVISPANGQLVMALAPMAGSVPWPTPLTFDQIPIGVSDQQTNTVRYQRASEGLQAADVDPRSGQIYVAWDDKRFRTDKTNDIVYVTSTDGGITWSAPARINPGSTTDNVDRYNAMIGVGSDGAVHVAYRQRQEDADAKGDGTTFSRTIDTFYQRSTDAGKTWSAPLKVDTTQATDFPYGAFSRGGLFEGDYNEIASNAGFTYIVRQEAYPRHAGDPPALHPTSGTNATTCDESGNSGVHWAANCTTLKYEHQTTWVAVVGPQSLALGASTGGPQASPSPSGGGVAASSGELPGTSGGPGALILLGLISAAVAASHRASPRKSPRESGFAGTPTRGRGQT